MSKVIGVVGEGPTDYMVIKDVVDHITGKANKYRRLQPEPDMAGRFGNFARDSNGCGCVQERKGSSLPVRAGQVRS